MGKVVTIKERKSYNNLLFLSNNPKTFMEQNDLSISILPARNPPISKVHHSKLIMIMLGMAKRM